MMGLEIDHMTKDTIVQMLPVAIIPKSSLYRNDG